MVALKEKKENALKTLLVFFVYFSYSYVVQTILTTFGISNSVLNMFLADVLFLIFAFLLYKDSILSGVKNFHKNYSLWKKIKMILGGFLILFLLNIVGTLLTDLIIPSSLVLDDNTTAIYGLLEVSVGYALFKSTFFTVIAEELVFKKSIRDVIDDNVVFIIVSSIIYGLVNIAYSSFSIVTVMDFVQCFFFSTVLSYIYVKYENNIVVVMLIKFTYNLIPITLMLAGI